MLYIWNVNYTSIKKTHISISIILLLFNIQWQLQRKPNTVWPKSPYTIWALLSLSLFPSFSRIQPPRPSFCCLIITNPLASRQELDCCFLSEKILPLEFGWLASFHYLVIRSHFTFLGESSPDHSSKSTPSLSIKLLPC